MSLLKKDTLVFSWKNFPGSHRFSKVALIIKVPLSYSAIVYLSTSSTLFDLQPILWYKTNQPSMFFFYWTVCFADCRVVHMTGLIRNPNFCQPVPVPASCLVLWKLTQLQERYYIVHYVLKRACLTRSVHPGSASEKHLYG